jgi:FAD synthetase
MSLEMLVSKYIASTEQVFKEIQIVKTPTINVDKEIVKKVLDFAKAYLEDAKYYKGEQKLETSLASIAYCEGLLDALRLLKMVKFEWHARKEKR